MENPVKDLFIEVNGPEAIPPAEMVGNKEHGKVLIIERAIKINLVEFSPCLPYRVEPEERVYEKMVGSPVDHSVSLKMMNRIMKNAPWQ